MTDLKVTGQLLQGSKWLDATGEAFTSENPATGEVLWSGKAASLLDLSDSVAAAQTAFQSWADLGFQARKQMIEAYGAQLQQHRAQLVEAIASEVGKPLWEAEAEVGTMIGKVIQSFKAHDDRTGVRQTDIPGGRAILRHRPHGVVAVIGPYNLPGHLPNAHIVPALLAGNTVVFKPSEQAPLVAELMVRCWQAAGLPKGVLNLIQGPQSTGEILASHPDINGLFFTGTTETGVALHHQFSASPEKILSLEMGGNNPLVVWEVENLEAAALVIIQSAYSTTGQHCTAARRLIIPSGAKGDALLETLLAWIGRLRVGAWRDDPAPFMGPLISNAAADHILATIAELEELGAKPLHASQRLYSERPFLTPALLDATGLHDVPDEEIFGPVLQVYRVDSYDDAIRAANKTRFGLAAGLISDDMKLWQQFLDRSRVGIVSWNRPLTGVSGVAPFGGIGISGNHRPSGYYAADYCAYPVASIEASQVKMPETLPLGFTGSET